MPIPRFHLVLSNRTEELALALTSRLRQEPRDDFVVSERDVIVVQGRGMAVWLNMELCRSEGIWANAEYLYPKNLVTRAFTALLPGGDAGAGYSWERLFWTVMERFPKLASEPEFAPLRSYLEGDQDGRRRFQLCDRIATTFDEYLTYRPFILERWHKQERSRTAAKKADRERPQLTLFGSATSDSSEAWQQRLWTTVRQELGDAHPALREEKLHKALASDVAAGALPNRISIFGLSSLPPLFLRVFCALSRHTQIDLYLLSASKHAVPDGGHRLLSSYSVAATEFRELLRETCADMNVELHEETRFEAPASATLLCQLQNEILEDRESEKLVRQDEDRSLAFHSCHSATREVEVLHDQLLYMIHTHGIEPHEIAVMAPNIDEYAPLVEAVFGRHMEDDRFIPYRISDRRLQGDSEIFDGLASLLSMVHSRVSSAEVLDLLTRTSVRERFDIAATDLETLRDWVTQSGARWGIDGDHRASFDLPRDHQNTWDFAAERLLIGYAVSTWGQDTSLGVLPYDEVEGKAGELLGRFARFLDMLFRKLEQFAARRTLTEWQVLLTGALAELFLDNAETSWQHEAIRQALGALVDASDEAEFEDEVPVSVVSQLLQRHFEHDRSARGFLSGGVTFCAMTPMRSIPFRVVWLLGMNDGAFPRQTFRPDFNLMHQSREGRKPGDPDRRLDDRTLFLECLLSARDAFVVSFVGQSIKDNAVLPPAVVINELLDGLCTRTRNTQGTPVGPKDLVLRHPLQPFSPRYYTTGAAQNYRLFSYEDGYLAGAKLLGEERVEQRPLFDTQLPAVEDKVVQLNDFIEFFSGPTESLLRRRLGVDLREQELHVPEREPTVLDGLEMYQVGAVALEHVLLDIDSDRSFELLRSSGALPPGAAGQFEFERALASARPIASLARPLRAVLARDRLAVDLPLMNGVRLQGELTELWARGLVRVQFARVRAKHLLQLWLRHLVLCFSRPGGVALQSTLLGRPEVGEGAEHVVYSEVSDPAAHLSTLAHLYFLGQRTPLALVPEPSLVFASTPPDKDGTNGRALFRASGAWPNELKRNAALRRVYGANAPLPGCDATEPETLETPSFETIAQAVFAPLLAHQQRTTK